MQQPELGRQLAALRKEKNLTQEELVEKSHVSVRTIQRIEAGEVLPRMSTVKIVLAALGESYESFSTKNSNNMETKNGTSNQQKKNALLVAVFAGAIYLVSEIILGTMDVAWLLREGKWESWLNLVYTGMTALMVISYTLFIRGFIVLSSVFENGLLRVAGFIAIIVVIGQGILDVTSLSAIDIDDLWAPYSAAAVIMGATCIIFGIALIRLQDSMGELSRAAGILEIIIGVALVTVVLFFIGYVVIVPAVIVEILVLYRGYEYLSKPAVTNAAA